MPLDEKTGDEATPTDGLDLDQKPDETVKAEEKLVETVKVEPDEDKEPGGDDPQAVRARKEYRLRKKTQEEAEVRVQAEREARIAAETRARTLEETKTKEPVRYTPRQVRDAVRAGAVTEEEGIRYLGRPIEDAVAEQIVEEKLAEDRKQSERQQVERQSGADVEKFVGHVPQLKDQTSEEFGKVRTTYRRLVGELGMPDTIQTQVVALELTFGNLTQLEGKKAAMAEHRDNAEHADVTGGTGKKAGNKKAEDAMTDAQKTFYRDRGWDASKDAPFAGIRNIHDLRKMRAAKT